MRLGRNLNANAARSRMDGVVVSGEPKRWRRVGSSRDDALALDTRRPREKSRLREGPLGPARKCKCSDGARHQPGMQGFRSEKLAPHINLCYPFTTSLYRALFTVLFSPCGAELSALPWELRGSASRATHHQLAPSTFGCMQHSQPPTLDLHQFNVRILRLPPIAAASLAAIPPCIAYSAYHATQSCSTPNLTESQVTFRLDGFLQS